MTSSAFLDSRMLIAMPSMSDARFERSLIYVCAHSENGAMGIIVNKLIPMMSFFDLMSSLDIVPDERHRDGNGILQMPVQFGGPVEPERGFVLHTADYFTADSSLPITEKIALTATLDILRAMANGVGPMRSMLALGYAGWAPGQLEDELSRNGWLHCDADDELLFGGRHEDKYAGALRKLGVDPAMLSSDAGHA